MTNKIFDTLKYKQILKQLMLIISISILLSNLAASEIDKFVPISVDIEVIDTISDAGDTSEINCIYNQSGIMIWKPNVQNISDDIKCYVMINKNNNQISLSMNGSERDLDRFLVPHIFKELYEINFLEMNKKTELYRILQNITNEAGIRLKGAPSYLSNNPNHSDITIQICNPGYCVNISASGLINLEIMDHLFIPCFTIFNVTPENNSVISGNQVEIDWQTELPSSSIVTIWEDGNSTPEVIEGPDEEVFHRVVKKNLSCGSSYRYDVTSSISNISKTISVTEKGRRFKTPFTLFNLTPKNNSIIDGDQVEFTWQTGCPSSSVVALWEDGNSTPEIIEGPDDVVFHRVVKTNLSCGSSYRYDVSSSISNQNVTEKGRRLKIGECAVRFIDKPYNFTVKRDYNQIRVIEIKNYGSRVRNVALNVSNATKDLIMGFMETGTDNESIHLNPSEKKERKLIIHAQDVVNEQYNLTAYLYDLDDSGKVLDTAPVRINIDFQPSFTITETHSDPETLVKTIRIDNLGDTLTDLQVRSYPESRISLYPQFNHYNLLKGKSREFYAIPIFSQGGEPINGNITANSGNESHSLPVSFACMDGKKIQKATLNYPQLTIEKDDYYCTNRPDIIMPFSMPPGFNSSDVVNAKMQIDFSLPSPKSQYLPHNITIYLNGRIIDQMVGVIPEGTYSYDLSGSDFNYALPGISTPGANAIRLKTEHMNPAHYIVSGKVTIRLCLKKMERWICASSEEEAERILWRTPGITPVSDNLYVNIIKPEEGANQPLNKSTSIKASVNGSIGGFITPQSNLEVFAKMDNGSAIELYDDGRHDDSKENDGIYAGEWIPTATGRVNISVYAMNCQHSGKGDNWVNIGNESFDLSVSKIDIMKSTVKPGKADMISTVLNIGNGISPSFRVNLSSGNQENLRKNWSSGLHSGQSMKFNWTLDDNELCGNEIRICVEAEATENNTMNNCLNSSYCSECASGKPDLVISEIENKTFNVAETIAFDFTAKNIGKTDALDPFALDLRINETLQDGKLLMDGLAADESKNGTFIISDLPEGTYLLSICIDADDTVDENDERNNNASALLKITSSASDLIVSSIEPRSAPANEPIIISFIARNVGENDAVAPIFAELRINDEFRDRKLIADGLAANESKNGTFMISDLPEGTYLLSICIDADDAVKETDEGNNCASEILMINGIESTVNRCGNKTVIINNPGPEVMNYPVRVQMPYARPDSLRFIDEQQNELYYWVEEGSETSSTMNVWINANRIHPGENKISVPASTIPSDYENPRKVFSFFDDFQTLNGSQWIYPSQSPGTQIDGSLFPEMGKIKIIKNSSSDSQQIFLQSRNEFPSGQSAIFRAELGGNQDWATQSMGFIKNHEPKIHPSLCWAADGKDITYFSDTGAKTVDNNFDPGYRVFEIRRQDNSIIFVMNGREINTSSTNSVGISIPIEFNIRSDIIDGSCQLVLDWVAVRDCRNGDLKAKLVDSVNI